MTELAPDERLLDIEEAAAFLDVSVRSVWRLIADPEIDLTLYRIQGLTRNNRRLKQSELLALLVPAEEITR